MEDEPVGCRTLLGLKVCLLPQVGAALWRASLPRTPPEGRPVAVEGLLRGGRAVPCGHWLSQRLSSPSPGQTCEIDINECVKSPCRAGASCQNTNGSYRCHCHAGYTGRNCETDIDDCRPSE